MVNINRPPPVRLLFAAAVLLRASWTECTILRGLRAPPAADAALSEHCLDGQGCKGSNLFASWPEQQVASSRPADVGSRTKGTSKACAQRRHDLVMQQARNEALSYRKSPVAKAA